MTTIIELFPSNMKNYRSGIFVIPQRNIDKVKVGTILRSYQPGRRDVYFDAVITVEMMKTYRLAKCKFKFENVVYLAEEFAADILANRIQLDPPIVFQERKVSPPTQAQAVLSGFGITQSEPQIQSVPKTDTNFSPKKETTYTEGLESDAVSTADAVLMVKELDLLKDEKDSYISTRLSDAFRFCVLAKYGRNKFSKLSLTAMVTSFKSGKDYKGISIDYFISSRQVNR